MDAWINPGYETTDHVIPWRLFHFLYQTIAPIMALERLNDSRGVAHGIAMALASKETSGKVDAVTRATSHEAFPPPE